MKRIYKSTDYVDAVCLSCRAPFRPLRWEVDRGRGKFCSHSCRLRARGLAIAPRLREQIGEGNFNWKGGIAKNRSRYARRYDVKYPEKAAARLAVRSALKSGQLARPAACLTCGKKCIPQGHHADYSKPLVVEWLCASCHRQKHGATH